MARFNTLLNYSVFQLLLALFLISNAQAQVAVDSSDKVAIGHLVPLYDLHVKAEEVVIQNKSGAKRVFIDSSGNVGIGTTAPKALFDIVSSGNTYGRMESNYKQPGARCGFTIDNTGFNTLGQILFSRGDTSRGGVGYSHNLGGLSEQLSFTVSGGSPKMVIKGNGRVGIGTTSPVEALEVNGNILAVDFVVPSDLQLKQDINNYNKGLEEVLRIQPKSYRYNEESNRSTEKTHIGLIAQELQEIVPEMVIETYDLSYDAEGNEIRSSENLGFLDNQIKYLLINAIKELNQKVELLKEQPPNNAEARSNIISIKLENAISDNRGFLSQSIPNPTDNRVVIPYYVPEQSRTAVIRFFNLNGQVLRELNLDQFGVGQIEVDVTDLVSGQYMYHLTIDGSLIDTKAMVIAK